jgi:hypothetical protein
MSAFHATSNGPAKSNGRPVCTNSARNGRRVLGANYCPFTPYDSRRTDADDDFREGPSVKDVDRAEYVRLLLTDRTTHQPLTL